MTTTRNSAIAQTLRTNPFSSLMRDVMAHEGQVDGQGYRVDEVSPGRGFSATAHSSKVMPNGLRVYCRTFYPGPMDGQAGLSTDISATYSVWVGWEEYNLEFERLYDAPPLALPHGATGWSDAAFDGPRHWYADFNAPDLAEAYAASQPEAIDGAPVAPLCRG